MSGKTPEEERLNAEFIAAENLARKEKNEADRWKAELEQKERESRRAGRMQLIGTVTTGVLTLIGTILGLFFGVGKKADPGVTNFWGTVYQGAVSSYKLVDSHYSVADAFPKAVPAASPVAPPPVVQPPAPATSTAITAPPPTQIFPIADGTCLGLNPQRWEIIPGSVSSYTQKYGATGYTIRLNLKNQSQDVMKIIRSGGELSDDQNHSLSLADSSISYGGGRAPTVVDVGVSLPATFQFQGNGNNGTTVSFTVNVATSIGEDRTYTNYVIGCTALPVHQVAK